VLQARARAGDLLRHDPRVKAIAALFIGGTRPFVDAVAQFGARAQATAAFHGARDPLVYLRSRNLISAETAALDLVDRLEVTERFTLFESVDLGALLDMTAAFLTTLEIHYDLFEAADEKAARLLLAGDDACERPEPLLPCPRSAGRGTAVTAL
jgi:hypothetical protein